MNDQTTQPERQTQPDDQRSSAPLHAVVRPLIALPRGMSTGFYLFMGAVCARDDAGKLSMTPPMPAKDCLRCIYRTEAWRDGGHCYMFRDDPPGDECGQFQTA